MCLQELNQHLHEERQLAVQLEEAKAMNKVLTTRTDEAAKNATQLQGIINQYGGLRGVRPVVYLLYVRSA
jgi:hypothetical protein